MPYPLGHWGDVNLVVKLKPGLFLFIKDKQSIQGCKVPYIMSVCPYFIELRFRDKSIANCFIYNVDLFDLNLGKIMRTTLNKYLDAGNVNTVDSI